MRYFKSLTAILFSIALAACGGGGGGGAPAATYSISGTVTGAASVAVTLSGASSATATTDASGNYSFTGLANGSYTVTPSKTGYAFNPISTAVTLSGANSTGNNFAATAAATTYSISGTVSGASGVTVALGGASSGSVVTGAGGAYSFNGVPAGNYTLTPSLSGYTFAPTSIAITALAANSSGNNFAATAIPVAHSISGTVSGAGGSGVTITVTGSANASASTDASGNYAVSLYDGSYTLQPSKTGYTFAPTSAAITVAGGVVTSGSTNFAGTANAAVQASVSGAISGPWPDGVTISVTGGGLSVPGTTNTSGGGNYSVGGLPSGQTYTVTPTLAGYTFTPPNAQVSIPGGSSAAVTVPTMLGASAIASATVSGTLSYNSGSPRTGTIFVRLTDAACTSSCAALRLTSLPNQGGNFSNIPFTIRGVQPGTYIIRSYIDTLDNGAGNSSNPGVTGTSFTVSGTTSPPPLALTILDPTALPASFSPPAPTVFPGDQAAIVGVTLPTDTIGREKATGYKIYWGSDTAASNGGVKTFPALGKNSDKFIVSGLSNGVTYFKIAALVGPVGSQTEYPPSAVTNPITIGAGTGGNTLSGTVSYSGAIAGPMLVIAYSATNGVYFTRIPSPVASQAYTITGIPSGTYRHIALIDKNNDGKVDLGDPNNTEGSHAPMVVMPAGGASMTSNLTLSAADATVVAATHHGADGVNPDWYALKVGTYNGLKRVVKSVLYSGDNIPVPSDIDVTDGQLTWMPLGVTPVAGTYKYRITYSDNTTFDLTTSMGAPLTTASMAQALAFTGTAPGTLSWSAPTTQPTFYAYGAGVFDSTTSAQLWWYPDLMPSTQTSVPYGGPALTTGTAYKMQVLMRDLTTDNSTSRSVLFNAP